MAFIIALLGFSGIGLGDFLFLLALIVDSSLSVLIFFCAGLAGVDFMDSFDFKNFRSEAYSLNLFGAILGYIFIYFSSLTFLIIILFLKIFKILFTKH